MGSASNFLNSVWEESRLGWLKAIMGVLASDRKAGGCERKKNEVGSDLWMLSSLTSCLKLGDLGGQVRLHMRLSFQF